MGIPITSHEGPNLANQNRRKLGVNVKKLAGSHSLFYCYIVLIDIREIESRKWNKTDNLTYIE